MELTPDNIIVFTIRGVAVNATIVNTWVGMARLTGLCALATRNLRPDVPPNRWRTALEVMVQGIQRQIEEITRRPSGNLVHFVGTLFLFIATCNLLEVVPGFDAPTASLSTTTALALSVLIAVPLFGISSRGLRGYLKICLDSTPIMLPFNIIAVILLSVAPFFFPVLMDLPGLLTGLIQAYIFAVLATVYISAARSETDRSNTEKEQK